MALHARERMKETYAYWQKVVGVNAPVAVALLVLSETMIDTVDRFVAEKLPELYPEDD